MMVKVGSARIDENGNIVGGKAGDQTGKEICLENGYIWKGGWTVCIRIRNLAKRKKYLNFIKWACATPLIGYDQGQRLTLYNALKEVDFDYRKLTKKVECDCSSLVACGLIVAGFKKISPACTTRSLEANMKTNYPSSFKFFGTSYKNGDHTKIMSYWKNGDILNKYGNHVVTVVSGGRTVATAVTTIGYYPKYIGNSQHIDEVFKEIGVPAKYRGSVSMRKPLAEKNGISNYKGTASENISLIDKAKKGKLKKL